MKKGLILFLVVVSLAACGQESTPEPTAENTPEVTEAADVAETPEVRGATATPDTTAASTPDPQVISSSDEYFIAVQAGLTEMPDSIPDAPDDSRWFAVVATLGNTAGDEVTVTTDNLILLTEDGERYTAEAADDIMTPPLVDSTLATGESVNGTVRFAIPEEAVPVRLQWCLDADCESVLQGAIP